MIFVLPDYVYGQRYIVAIGEDDKAILAKFRAEGEEVDDDLRQKVSMQGYGRSLWLTTGYVHLLRLKRMDIRQANDIGVLAHEATHLTMSLFSQLKQPIAPDNDEPFAYYVQFLVREVLRKAGR